VLEVRIALAKLGFGAVFAFASLGLFLVLMDEGKISTTKIKIKNFIKFIEGWFNQQTATFMSLFASPPRKRT